MTSRSILISCQIIFAIAAWYIIGSKIIPTPDEILKAIPVLWSQGLGYELYRSFVVNSKALIISFCIALSLAYLTTLPDGIGYFFRPIVKFISSLRFLGLIGLTLIFTLVAPNGHWLKVYLLVFGITAFMLTSLNDIVASIPKENFDDAKTLGMSKYRVILEVVVLGTASSALEVVRSCGAISWTMLTSVEGLVRSEGGLGGLLLNADKYLHLTNIFAIQLVILLVGLFFDFIIEQIRKLSCPYAYLKLERK